MNEKTVPRGGSWRPGVTGGPSVPPGFHKPGWAGQRTRSLSAERGSGCSSHGSDGTGAEPLRPDGVDGSAVRCQGRKRAWRSVGLAAKGSGVGGPIWCRQPGKHAVYLLAVTSQRARARTQRGLDGALHAGKSHRLPPAAVQAQEGAGLCPGLCASGPQTEGGGWKLRGLFGRMCPGRVQARERPWT